MQASGWFCRAYLQVPPGPWKYRRVKMRVCPLSGISCRNALCVYVRSDLKWLIWRGALRVLCYFLLGTLFFPFKRK